MSPGARAELGCVAHGQAGRDLCAPLLIPIGVAPASPNSVGGEAVAGAERGVEPGIRAFWAGFMPVFQVKSGGLKTPENASKMVKSGLWKTCLLFIFFNGLPCVL